MTGLAVGVCCVWGKRQEEEVEFIEGRLGGAKDDMVYVDSRKGKWQEMEWSEKRSQGLWGRGVGRRVVAYTPSI